MKTIKHAALFAVAILTAMVVSRYLTMNPEVYFRPQRGIYMDHPIALLTHVIGGMVAILIGPFQFVESFRTRFVKLHRGLGSLYIIACIAGGIAGIMMATRAFGGFASQLGFGLIAVSWITCAAFALHRALTKRFPAHREWMIRSYALTLTAFTQRVILYTSDVAEDAGLLDASYREVYVAGVWLSWVVSIIIAEVYINRSRAPLAIERNEPALATR